MTHTRDVAAAALGPRHSARATRATTMDMTAMPATIDHSNDPL